MKLTIIYIVCPTQPIPYLLMPWRLSSHRISRLYSGLLHLCLVSNNLCLYLNLNLALCWNSIATSLNGFRHRGSWTLEQSCKMIWASFCLKSPATRLRNHHISVSLTFCDGIHQFGLLRVNSHHKRTSNAKSVSMPCRHHELADRLPVDQICMLPIFQCSGLIKVRVNHSVCS